MMMLTDLFTKFDVLPEELANLQDLTLANLPFNALQVDSRKVADGDVFILLKPQGSEPDFEKIKSYLNQVADKAVFVLSELDLSVISDFVIGYETPIFITPDIRTYLGDLIKFSLQNQSPSTLPTVIAVTGTNGKTTISQLVAQFAHLAGQKTAVMGTAGNGVLGENGLSDLTPSTHTTLEVFALQNALYDYAKQGVETLSIEASSHGLHQNRLQGVPVSVAIFTNLTRDHLDYHHDMDEYACAKSRLFDKNLFPYLTHAIINLDDEYSQIFIDKAKASNLTVWTYSLNDNGADIVATNIAPSLDGVGLTIATPMGEMTATSPLLGRFNVANLLAGVGASLATGIDLDKIASAISHLKGASGRMERVPSKFGAFIVDYAHTPDATEQVLSSLRTHCTGTLFAVLGCGGDRDKGKRPLMTKSALKFADKVILTADNPRSEEPLAILKDMQEGLDCESHYKIEIEPDRKLAIELAVKLAGENDIVAILGKGHETYQEIQGVRYDFDDRVVVGEMVGKFGK
ncbi:MAG: UDP-N-acetylmuramoyl-L-alanyl-D-glutamate--2,6-diaminopimelate ligase [Moraxella sp.]|uniref:UDP-N-acetylmuramoyl-L-alanyl-D-glutamate--2, 6-diaminopimelate ligase n=1 Tax=Moraxella sp. TaxID=479 RepID=UPI0026DC9819|nr:UDP-N-acetylmuramoyl-L-alanyl-D-glutamate--2,6-diaminopimelate ligase [Moraxella sp.]MDO4450664.1 UDP-N-acetylmuramoyl-L-alanyl-D-glutamate--2,6-diaminopimelate ligase [Moraxella sp.]